MPGAPKPPKVGARFLGPSRTERASRRGTFATVHHVRAVVDHVEDPEWGHLYQVVLRWYSPRHGWRYMVESQWAFKVLSGDRALYEKPRRS